MPSRSFITRRFTSTGIASGGGGGEVLWINQPTDDDFWSGSVHSQKIQNSTVRTITRIRVKIENTAGDQTVTMGLYSTPETGGTQYGTTSNDVSVLTSGPTWYEFTWASNPTTPASDFYIRYSGGSTIRQRCSTVTGGVAYVDTTYSSYSDASNRTTSDFTMEVYTA